MGEGVKSEFFHCIFEEMTKTEYGMFIYPEEGSYMWFPVSVSLLFIFLQFYRTEKVYHIPQHKTIHDNVKLDHINSLVTHDPEQQL